MSDHESFEDRLRAMADEISRSMQRMSELDVEHLAEKYGVDADRARGFADAAGRWLSDHLSGAEPLFGQPPPRRDADVPATPASPGLDAPVAAGAESARSASKPGPHPLDLPSGEQGVVLSALDSGRWTVRPGSNQLEGNGDGPPPSQARDVVNELRARDWITADGTLTLVGRHALARWCRTAQDPASPPDETGAPGL
jgi:hypothetical protein